MDRKERRRRIATVLVDRFCWWWGAFIVFFLPAFKLSLDWQSMNHDTGIDIVYAKHTNSAIQFWIRFRFESCIIEGQKQFKNFQFFHANGYISYGCELCWAFFWSVCVFGGVLFTLCLLSRGGGIVFYIMASPKCILLLFCFIGNMTLYGLQLQLM